MIHFRGRSLDLHQGETVLECLERSGESIPSSCRNGICQSCMLQASSGDVPPESQKGLKPSLRKQGYLLACACRPQSDLVLSSESPVPNFDSTVVASEPLATGVFRVLLEKPAGMEYAAGQFVQVERPSDGLTRPYSLASLPSQACLELHIRVRETGTMSRWLSSAVGEAVRVRGPQGECCYDPAEPERPLLLIGTGTGLSPLLGVLRDALQHGHSGPIRLTHGAQSLAGLYAWQGLLELARQHANVSLQGLVAEAPSAEVPFVQVGKVGNHLLGPQFPLSQSEIFLCGNPGLVQTLKKFAYLNGASLSHIHADPFLTAVVPARQAQANAAGDTALKSA